MRNVDAYIYAGGLGTRLADTFPNLPKFLVPVCNQAIGFRIVQRLRTYDVRRIVLGLGHGHERILGWLRAYQTVHKYGKTICIVEEEQLGREHALRLAIPYLTSDHVLTINGDTLWNGDLEEVLNFHKDSNAPMTSVLFHNMDVGIRFYTRAALCAEWDAHLPHATYLTSIPYFDIGTPEGWQLAEAVMKREHGQ